jgi:23S rRNA A1618 N6-methylase RlmF
MQQTLLFSCARTKPSSLSPHHPIPCGVVVCRGTGASCIFPLLGHGTYGWSFVATEIDPESVRSAQQNIDANSLRKTVR